MGLTAFGVRPRYFVVCRNACLGFVAALSPISFPTRVTKRGLLKNSILVYGACVEASGWTAVG
jgi:hypothetical protein